MIVCLIWFGKWILVFCNNLKINFIKRVLKIGGSGIFFNEVLIVYISLSGNILGWKVMVVIYIVGKRKVIKKFIKWIIWMKELII